MPRRTKRGNKEKEGDIIITPDMMVDAETLPLLYGSHAGRMAIRRGSFIRRNFLHKHEGHSTVDSLVIDPNTGTYQLIVKCMHCQDSWRVETQTYLDEGGRVWIHTMISRHVGIAHLYGSKVSYSVDYAFQENPTEGHARRVHISSASQIS